MSFDDKIAALQEARAQADRRYLEATQTARDAYVGVGQAHVAAETAWLNSPADQALQDAAATTWQALNEARDDLLAAASAAGDERTQALATAWADIRAQTEP